MPDTTPVAPARRRGRRAGLRHRLPLAAGIGLLALLATGCDNNNVWVRAGWPKPVTDQGRKVLGLWQGSMIAALVVGGFVIFLILFSAIAFRRRGDELPRQVRYNLPIEFLYTLVPVVIVSVLFYFTALRENDQDKFGAPAKLRVEVVGFQWSWQFNYIDDGLTVTGRPGEPPQLVLPTAEAIRFFEKSPDVIHSWWVIPFLFKRDVIPGRTNSFQLTVTSAGVFQGKCAEYCGIDHSRMLFTVKAVSPAEFQTWLADAKAKAAAGTDTRYTVFTGETVYGGKNDGTQQTQRSYP